MKLLYEALFGAEERKKTLSQDINNMQRRKL